eukprot:12377982-Ditylum_brightwellii.AAC.1
MHTNDIVEYTKKIDHSTDFVEEYMCCSYEAKLVIHGVFLFSLEDSYIKTKYVSISIFNCTSK